MPTIADHILAFVLIIAFPVYSWFEFGRLKRARAAMLEAGQRVPLSALIFGIAHIYQCPSGIPKTGPIGLVCAAMYIVRGSLWLPMLMHFAIDLFSGRMSFDALTVDAGNTLPQEPLPVVSPAGAPAT